VPLALSQKGIEASVNGIPGNPRMPEIGTSGLMSGERETEDYGDSCIFS